MFYSLLRRLTGVTREDARLALPAFGYFFFILCAYYIMHPIRDEMGLLLGKDYLPTLFRWSMLCVILANPIFSFLVNRTDRRQFMAITYRFFAANLVLFIVALKYLEGQGLVGAQGEAATVAGGARLVLIAFYLWVGIYNLFGFSIFWALMADVFKSADGKRIFGFIGAGGTTGQAAGSLLSEQLVDALGPTNLLWLSVLFLEFGVRSMLVIVDRAEIPKSVDPVKEKSTVWSGVTDTLRSPYLLTICLFIFLKTFTASVLYFEKQDLVDTLIADREGRVAYFSKINLVIAVLTIFSQIFLTGRVLPLLGITFMLLLIPVISLGGFLALHMKPVLWVLAAFEVARKAGSFSFAKPARELLFTVVSRREKYLAKSFIDTFVHRFGDVSASIAVGSFGLGALAALPITGVWLGVGVVLGRAQSKKEAAEGKEKEPS